MKAYDKLIAAGIDMDALLKRLMGNASLVKIFIGKFIEDTNLTALREAFAAGDMKAAEMASHTLKGMCGNLSLTQLYTLFTEQVVRIRAEEYPAAERMMETIVPLYEGAVALMRTWLQEV